MENCCFETGKDFPLPACMTQNYILWHAKSDILFPTEKCNHLSYFFKCRLCKRMLYSS